MNKYSNKCAMNFVTVCLIAAMLVSTVFSAVLANTNPISPEADSYAIAGFDSVGGGSVQDSPEDGTSSIGAMVRSWIYTRSNEIAQEADITGSATPTGIGQTTDIVDGGTGAVGRSWVDHGFSIDAAGFSTLL